MKQTTMTQTLAFEAVCLILNEEQMLHMSQEITDLMGRKSSIGLFDGTLRELVSLVNTDDVSLDGMRLQDAVVLKLEAKGDGLYIVLAEGEPQVEEEPDFGDFSV